MALNLRAVKSVKGLIRPERLGAHHGAMDGHGDAVHLSSNSGYSRSDTAPGTSPLAEAQKDLDLFFDSPVATE